MAEAESPIFALLRERRAEMKAQAGEASTDADESDRRRRRMAELRRAVTGESMFGSSLPAEVEERLERTERRLDALEGRP